MNINKSIFIVILSVCMFVPAQAYIDPATGSLAMQVLLGGIAAGYVFFRTHITKIVNKIKSLFAEKKDN